MIRPVQPVSYNNSVFKVQQVRPIRGKDEVVTSSPTEEKKETEAFYPQYNTERLLDVII
jgi:hypothetical protein